MAARYLATHNFRMYCETESNYVFSVANTVPEACPYDYSHTLNSNETVAVKEIEGVKLVSQVYNTGRYNEISVNYDSCLRTDIPKSSFGLTRVTGETPVVQVDFVYGVLNETVNTSTLGGSTITGSNGMAFLDSGSNVPASAIISTKRYARYRPGQGMNIMFTVVFGPGRHGNVQLAGCGNACDGLFFGYNGTKFGIMRRRNCVDTWIYQDQWNLEKMDGKGQTKQTLNTATGNVYRITFQWLGFGAMTFYIEDNVTGDFTPVHRICYANMNTETSLKNPSFPITWQNINTSNNIPTTLVAPCCAAFVEGTKTFLGLNFGIDNTKTISSNTDLINVITIRNKDHYKDITHFIQLFVRLLSVGTDGTKNVVVYLVKNATIGGTPSFTNINAESSIVDYDTVGSTVTGGIPVAAFTFAKVESRTQSLTDLDIMLEPSETLTVAAKLTGVGSTELSASMTWLEDR